MIVSRTCRRRSVSGARVACDGRVVLTTRNRRGAMIVLVGILLVSMVGLFALAVDFGRLDSLRADLQTSADAAALAGAVELIKEASAAPASDPRTVAIGWVAKNPAMNAAVSVDSVFCGTFADAGPAFLPDYSPTVGCAGGVYNAIEITVSRQSSGLFMAALGVTAPTLKATATAAVSPDTIPFPPYGACLPTNCRVFLVLNRR